MAAVTLVRMCLSFDTFWGRYDTSVPAGGYLIVMVVSLFLGTVAFFFAGTVTAGFAGALIPDAVSMFRRDSRRAYARDALVAGVVALGFAIGLPGILRLLGAAVPAGRLVGGMSSPGGIDSRLPALFSAANALSLAIFVPAFAAIVLAVLSRYFRRPGLRVLLGIFFVLSFLPGAARTAPEFALGALSLLVGSALVIVLAAFFFRNNPLAWVWSLWFGRGGASAIQLLSEPSGAYRLHGGVLLVAVLASAAWLLLGAGRRPGDAPAS